AGANVGRARATILHRNRPPEQTETSHALDNVARESFIDIVISRHWDDVFVGEFPCHLPHSALFISEVEVHASFSASSRFHSAHMSTAHFKYADSLNGSRTG